MKLIKFTNKMGCTVSLNPMTITSISHDVQYGSLGHTPHGAIITTVGGEKHHTTIDADELTKQWEKTLT